MKIFCDLDGVLADFVSAAFEIHGYENLYEKYPEKYSGVYDICKVMEISKREFWKPIQGESFWKNLPLLPDAKNLIGSLENNFGRENIYFLTSPSLDIGCYTGKLKWVHQHFPFYTYRTILFTKKYFLSDYRSFLIDDSPSNLKHFSLEGGTGILYPRIWNTIRKPLPEPSDTCKDIVITIYSAYNGR